MTLSFCKKIYKPNLRKIRPIESIQSRKPKKMNARRHLATFLEPLRQVLTEPLNQSHCEIHQTFYRRQVPSVNVTF
jgi:hypothetical protein